MEKQEMELLAPAGSYEGFLAALDAGADAVYVGGTAFGARAYAKNFQEEELLHAIDTAHLYGKKLYLTINTLMKNRELGEQLYDYLRPYYEAGLDAVIVQDLGVFSAVKKMFPGLSLHASTQMTVTGPKGMKFLEELGASRVVTARELSLDEIRRMREASPIEIETFVHGALCYSYSGQCLMSSLLGGRSGNRGRCAQPCRLPYEEAGVKKAKKERCPLSLKDLSSIELLPQIMEAGITSLKIEGRMKQPGYAAGVTAIYRKYLDLLMEKGKENYRVEEKDRQYLRELFSRGGSCTGYLRQQNGPSMMDFTNEKKMGDQAERPALPVPKKIGLTGRLEMTPGEPVRLYASLGDISAEVCSDQPAEEAKSRPLTKERIRQQMEKLGNTLYQWEKLEIILGGDAFCPMGSLNELRRDVIASLEEKLLASYRRSDAAPFHIPKAKNHPTEGPAVYISCESAETARKFIGEKGVTGLYLNADAMDVCFEDGLSAGLELYLMLPHIQRGEFPSALMEQIKSWLDWGMKGVLVRNLETFSALRQQGLSDKCVLDHSLYTWNNEAAAFWRNQGVLRCTLPLELNEGELGHRDNRDGELLVYGYLPVMLSAQCVQKNLHSCTRKNDHVVLKDRYDKKFLCQCVCKPWKTENTGEKEPCYNIIYNSIPLGLFGELKKAERLGVQSFRLSFTRETPAEALGIFREFMESCKSGRYSGRREFTKGHFKRGAE